MKLVLDTTVTTRVVVSVDVPGNEMALLSEDDLLKWVYGALEKPHMNLDELYGNAPSDGLVIKAVGNPESYLDVMDSEVIK